MFVLEVLNDGGEWETICEFFNCVEDAEAYYEHQLAVFPEYRVTEIEEA